MQQNLFKNFDFSLLDSPDFKEDAVREELITPLLHTLGYQSHGDFKILRSKSLLHPFVMIGSKKHKVNIIPDYLLQVKTRFAWVLDAKSPNQNIIIGSNVEQVYSYAIHPEIRVPVYALCNGHELAIFHIKQIQPVLRLRLRNITEKWSELEQVLSPYTVFNYEPQPINLYPDYGLYLYKLGYTDTEVKYFFYEMTISHIDRVDDVTFSTLINIEVDKIEFAISFDFDFERLKVLLELAPQHQRQMIMSGLCRQPYRVDILPPFTVNLGARLGFLTKTKFEEIIPLVVEEFF